MHESLAPVVTLLSCWIVLSDAWVRAVSVQFLSPLRKQEIQRFYDSPKSYFGHQLVHCSDVTRIVKCPGGRSLAHGTSEAGGNDGRGRNWGITAGVGHCPSQTPLICSVVSTCAALPLSSDATRALSRSESDATLASYRVGLFLSRSDQRTYGTTLTVPLRAGISRTSRCVWLELGVGRRSLGLIVLRPPTANLSHNFASPKCESDPQKNLFCGVSFTCESEPQFLWYVPHLRI